MKSFYEMLPILAEARTPKGTPTSLNVWVMFKSLEKGGGVISDRVESVDLIHLRRCLEAGFLERGASGGFVPTQKGIEAMEKELALKMSRDPDYKRPAWMGVESGTLKMIENLDQGSRTYRIALMDEDGTVVDSADLSASSEDRFVNISLSAGRDPRADESFELR